LRRPRRVRDRFAAGSGHFGQVEGRRRDSTAAAGQLVGARRGPMRAFDCAGCASGPCGWPVPGWAHGRYGSRRRPLSEENHAGQAKRRTPAGRNWPVSFFPEKALDNGACLCYNSRTSLSCASCGYLPHAVSFLLFRLLVSQAEGSGEPGYPAEALRCMAPALHPGRLNAAAPGGKKSS